MDVRTSYLPVAEYYSGRDPETALVIAMIEKICTDSVPTHEQIEKCREAAKNILKDAPKSDPCFTSGGPVGSSNIPQGAMNTNVRPIKAE